MSIKSPDFNVETVPAEYVSRVARLRDYLDDTITQNELRGVEESTDLELYRALEDTWDEINYEHDPVELNFDSISQIPWTLLRQGATLSVLNSKIIGSARNTLSYNDAGGINVKDNDVFGRYVAIYNTLLSQYRRAVATFKRSANVNSCYGGSHSEYWDIS